MDDGPPQPRPPAPTPGDRDGREHDMHAVRTPLTVAILRTQILRRHLRRGDEMPRLEAELDQIGAALAQLAVEIDQLDRTHDRERR
jgi:signal transduction histidine kinase